jgi:hypothetical protein
MSAAALGEKIDNLEEPVIKACSHRLESLGLLEKYLPALFEAILGRLDCT